MSEIENKQSGEKSKPNAGRSRRLRGAVVVLLFAGLVTAVATYRAGARAEPCDTVAQGESIAPVDLPGGLGRGFPIVCLTERESSPSAVKAGAIAPNFYMVLDKDTVLDETAQTTQGHFSLESLQGKPVLINFWASWCGPCRQEMPDIVQATDEYADLVVLAVNVQEEAAAYQAFVNEFGMTMPVVSDPKGELRRLYSIRNMPTSVFIHRDGTVSTIWAGFLTPDKLQEFIGQIL